MLSEYGFWVLCSYTTSLSEEEQCKSKTGADRVAYADETPKGILSRIRSVRNYKLSQIRKGVIIDSSAETYEFTLIRKHRSKRYAGPDLRYRAFMEPVYDGDCKKYPGVRCAEIGVPYIADFCKDRICPGVKFICYLDETPVEFLSIIKKFPNVEFKKSRKEVSEH